ncbi:MAG: cytidine deaminase [Clostridia bacterium]|nr:cytidine deaminase [Clostridia bacterium]
MCKFIDKEKLVLCALKAKEMSYSPYSSFNVGAALLTKSGKIYTGCNIESAAYSPTNCAERTAFFKAISEGERDFCAIAIVGSKKNVPADYCFPCGVCRQVMAEFVKPDEFIVLVARSVDDIRKYTLEELFPYHFKM